MSGHIGLSLRALVLAICETSPRRAVSDPLWLRNTNVRTCARAASSTERSAGRHAPVSSDSGARSATEPAAAQPGEAVTAFWSPQWFAGRGALTAWCLSPSKPARCPLSRARSSVAGSCPSESRRLGALGTRAGCREPRQLRGTRAWPCRDGRLWRGAWTWRVDRWLMCSVPIWNIGCVSVAVWWWRHWLSHT